MTNEDAYSAAEQALFWEFALDHPKVQFLKPEMFKAWFNFTVCAFRNGGLYPYADELAFQCRAHIRKVERQLDYLEAAGLIIDRGDGRRIPFGFPRNESHEPTPQRRRFRVLTGGKR